MATIGAMTRLQTTAYTAQSNANTKAAAAKSSDAISSATNSAAEESSALNSQAYSVDISDAAQDAANAEKTKGLTTDQIDALKSDIDKTYEVMIQAMTDQNARLQGWLDEGIGFFDFGDLKIDTSRFALPEVATTPEEAQAAISEDGDWGVNAVASRIFDLASAIAGNDPEQLEKMRAAVEKGFEQAGITWKNTFGTDNMPQITKDTHAEITKRFDARAAELAAASQETAATEETVEA